MISLLIANLVFGLVTSASFECFEFEPQLYGNTEGVITDDLDQILKLDKNHVITKVEGCKSEEGWLSSV